MAIVQGDLFFEDSRFPDWEAGHENNRRDYIASQAKKVSIELDPRIKNRIVNAFLRVAEITRQNSEEYSREFFIFMTAALGCLHAVQRWHGKTSRILTVVEIEFKKQNCFRPFSELKPIGDEGFGLYKSAAIFIAFPFMNSSFYEQVSEGADYKKLASDLLCSDSPKEASSVYSGEIESLATAFSETFYYNYFLR